LVISYSFFIKTGLFYSPVFYCPKQSYLVKSHPVSQNNSVHLVLMFKTAKNKQHQQQFLCLPFDES